MTTRRHPIRPLGRHTEAKERQAHGRSEGKGLGRPSAPGEKHAQSYAGFPGRPLAFLETVQIGIVDDVLTTRKRAQPLILVMPFGSTGTFTDKEWVNGVAPHDRWASFVASDLVSAIDARYRTIRAASGRAIAGLSEGGYGVENINAVSMKSIASTDSDDTTTVRVVA